MLGIRMSHRFGNCASLCAVRSPEDLRVFTVLSKTKKRVVKSVKPSFYPLGFEILASEDTTSLYSLHSVQ